MNISGITNPLRGYEVTGKKNTKVSRAEPSFDRQIAAQNTGDTTHFNTLVDDRPVVSAAISGEEYLKLCQDSTVANSSEVKSAAEHRALIETANQVPFEEVASDKDVATTKINAVPPMPDFTGMSDSQKLSTLRKLHEATDYSGMTDVEKYKIMNDRFEAAFPNLSALLSGIYGPTGTNLEEFDPNYRPLLPERVSEARGDQWLDLGLKNTGRGPVNLLHKEAYYSGMTDEEIISAINKKYSGNTLENRVAILRELMVVGLDNGSAGKALDAIGNSLLSQVRGAPVYDAMFSNPQNGIEFSKLVPLASGSRMSWGTVGSMVLSSSREYALSCFDPALALKEHEEFEENWNELLELLMQAGA